MKALHILSKTLKASSPYGKSINHKYNQGDVSHPCKLDRLKGQLYVSFLIGFFALSSCTLVLAAPQILSIMPHR